MIAIDRGPRALTGRRAGGSLALALVGLACSGSLGAVLVPWWMRGWWFPPALDLRVALVLLVVAAGTGSAAIVLGGGEGRTAPAATVGVIGHALGWFGVVLVAAAVLGFVTALVEGLNNFT